MAVSSLYPHAPPHNPSVDWRYALRGLGKFAWTHAQKLDAAMNERVPEWARNEGRPSVIVFVHGLLGENERAWRSPRSDWVEIVLADPDLADFDVLRAEWYTTLLSGEFDLHDCADQLALHLSSPVGGNSPALSARRLLFVCHSMGGLVVRQALVNCPELTHDRTVSVLSYGTPARGVELADRFEDVARVFGQKQVLDLSQSSPVLAALHERFSALARLSPPAVDGLELVESDLLVPPPGVLRAVRRFLPHTPPIVGVESQGGYFGPPVVLPWTDHRSISRPTSARHPSHASLRRFVKARMG